MAVQVNFVPDAVIVALITETRLDIMFLCIEHMVNYVVCVEK